MQLLVRLCFWMSFPRINQAWMLIVMCALLLPAHELLAQNGSSDISAMRNSERYHFSGNQYQSHQPSWQPSGGAMEVMQGRYDYAFEILQTEYKKINSLSLINLQNQQLLTSYKTTSDFAGKLSMFSKSDITKPANYNYWYQLFTAPYSLMLRSSFPV
jgi:hypothetical protein